MDSPASFLFFSFLSSMHFFTHVLLQATYLGSWLFFAGWGLCYQAKAYHWMLRQRVPIQWMLRRDDFLWGLVWTVMSAALIGFLTWIHWQYAASAVRLMAPVGIMLAILAGANAQAWYRFEARSCEPMTA